VSAFLPQPARGQAADRDFPRLQQRPFSPVEQRARWEVRAAQWRAREIAESVFGRVASTALLGIRPSGTLRGLLQLEVPFDDLDAHRARERRFLAAAHSDPILAQVPLVYAFAPKAP
jgi:hypothetical protein